MSLVSGQQVKVSGRSAEIVPSSNQSNQDDHYSQAVRLCANITSLASKTQAHEVMALIEEHSGDYIRLSDEYDQPSGDPYVSSDIPDHLLPELIKDHGCILRADEESDGYLIVVPDSADVFISKAIMESLSLALEGSNIPMMYSPSHAMVSALILPGIICDSDSYPDDSFIAHIDTCLEDVMDRSEVVDPSEPDETISEGLKMAMESNTDKSVLELINLLGKVVSGSCCLSLEEDQLIITSPFINKNSMCMLLTTWQGRLEGYETLKIDANQGKITTTNTDLIADLRVHLIKKALKL
uniref:Uncharacterized protein n=1 Tax=viral metagenome TaxID=1070528 RepID=A0A6C0BMK8_9ZZZZ